MRVAAVIPLYNKAPYVERALRSVLGQTRRPDEIIVVDDGSTDEGPEIVRRLGGDLVRLISQKHAGVSAARNRGTREATTDLVAFLDADDEWNPRFIEALLGALEQFPEAVVVFSNFRRGTAPTPALQPNSGAPMLLRDFFAFAIRNRSSGMYASTVLVNRNALLSIGGFPEGESFGEDVDTWARLAWTGPVVYVPEVLAVYWADDPRSVTRQFRVHHLRPHPVSVTYELWVEQGRIPPQLRRSSRVYVSLQNRWYVERLILGGHRRLALAGLLKFCKPTPHVSGYAKLWARLVLPESLYTFLRLAKRRVLSRVRECAGD